MARRPGRPATGRTTKTVRVPLDMDMELAVAAYYDWLPVLLAARDALTTSPRHDGLRKVLEQLHLPDRAVAHKPSTNHDTV
jgi:hypothetical protein